MEVAKIPLSLYVHIPWCVRKCPYCDFNSHAVQGDIDEARYVDALLRDLSLDIPLAEGRSVGSIFVGGGTPSLLSGSAVSRLLQGVRDLVVIDGAAEITLEANPGTVDSGHFAAYRDAGVNRLSIGVQSFDDRKLETLGRIHSGADAVNAVRLANEAGFENINLDLMFGLPGQDVEGAKADLQQAIELAPGHLSWYQLTIEPHTEFNRARPADMPDDDAVWAMQEAGEELLASTGYGRYEVSAWARDGRECNHNRNYWEFGDYIGVGAGAHGKLTHADGRIERRRRERHPDAYLAGVETADAVSGTSLLQDEDLVLEFMMNALRLYRGVPAVMLEARTGLKLTAVEPRLGLAVQRGLLEDDPAVIRATVLGQRHLNGLLTYFV